MVGLLHHSYKHSALGESRNILAFSFIVINHLLLGTYDEIGSML